MDTALRPDIQVKCSLHKTSAATLQVVYIEEEKDIKHKLWMHDGGDDPYKRHLLLY